MLAPKPVARREVVYPSQILELVNGCLALRDAQFVLELPTGRNPHPTLVSHVLLLIKVIERVRAASVRPHVWERDLLRGALLQKQASIAGPEDEGGECTMQETFVYVLH